MLPTIKGEPNYSYMDTYMRQIAERKLAKYLRYIQSKEI